MSTMPLLTDNDLSEVKFLVPTECNSESSECHLQYHPDGLLKLVDTDDRVLDIVDVEDLVGCSLEISGSLEDDPRATASTPISNQPESTALVDRQGSATLALYVYPHSIQSSWFQSCRSSTPNKPTPHYVRPTKWSGSRVSHPRRWTLAPSEDLAATNQLASQLQQLATGPLTTPRKYLILVNPFSGQKKGLAYCEEYVEPLLTQAGVEYEVLVTTHANHAKDHVASVDWSHAYQGVVLMGGDGIIHEFFNGIMEREDASDVLDRVVVGIVGCGTCNGFATTVALASGEGAYGPLTEAFLVAKGRTGRMDLSRYETLTKSYISHLSFSWAIIADIDIESEVIRWVGEPRVDIWAAIRCIFLRRYRGRLSYLPEEESLQGMPALSDPVPENWITIEDDILLFWPHQATHAAMHTHSSPKSKLEDGIFQIMLVRGRKISRIYMARILLALESGSHVDMPGVEFIQCKAYRLEPLSPGSYNNIDGEVVEPGPVQAKVLPGAARLFCNPKYTK